MVTLAGKGTGIGAISDAIINACVDADLSEKLGEVEYSTNPRKIVTVEDMINHSIRRGDFSE